MSALTENLHEQSIEVLLAQVKGSVRDRMRRPGLMDAIGEDRIYLSVGSAAEAFQARQALVTKPADRSIPGTRRPDPDDGADDN